jgi:hypothetical protein
LVVLEDGVPIMATDPWLIGSCYRRSWWLERPPTPAEIDLVRETRLLYVTHSHPDHLHFPSIRHLGTAKTFLSPNFPGYPVPEYLEGKGHSAITLRPFRWYRLSVGVWVAFAQVPIDDLILVIDTPSAVIVNLNDSYPSKRLLAAIGRRLVAPGKKVVVLKSHSPGLPLGQPVQGDLQGHRGTLDIADGGLFQAVR